MKQLWVLFAAIVLAAATISAGQNVQPPPIEVGPITVSSGLNVVPSFEGWEKNADGTFNLVFGYLNRNYDEIVDIPIGPNNSIEPGGPDRGQPTHFFPRINRWRKDKKADEVNTLDDLKELLQIYGSAK